MKWGVLVPVVDSLLLVTSISFVGKMSSKRSLHFSPSGHSPKSKKTNRSGKQSKLIQAAFQVDKKHLLYIESFHNLQSTLCLLC